jgi:hypothetical protein
MGFSKDRYPHHNPLVLDLMHEFHVRFHVIPSNQEYWQKPTAKYVWNRVKQWLKEGYNFKECKALLKRTYPLEDNYAEAYEKRERRVFLAQFREIDYSGVDEAY